MVKFVYHGHAVVAPVIDRGPYIKGRAWDLTEAAAEALGLRRRRARSATRSPSSYARKYALSAAQHALHCRSDG